MVEELYKCLHCGHEYRMPTDSRTDIRERVCPRCQSNSVRKLPTKK